MTDDYQQFLQSKQLVVPAAGFEPDQGFYPPQLFGFQKQIVTWTVRRGRAAVFADCGLGKTLMQLAWSVQVTRYTDMPVLILAPLGVVEQTVAEGEKFGIIVTPVESMKDLAKHIGGGIFITNYEKLHKMDPSKFGGIGLDESSILKSYDGATKQAILEAFAQTPYRSAWSATPAPNDHMELGNHAEFMGLMSRVEMLSQFFVHDGGDTSKWRLMGHAENEFWKWMAQWSVMIRKPSDLGYDDNGFVLPALTISHEVVDSPVPEGMLIPMAAKTLTERRQARRASLSDRVQKAVDLVNARPDEKWLIWCNLNDEQNELEKALGKRCVSVQGSTKPDQRLKNEQAWRLDDVAIMISKPSVFGFGMNWQHCHNVVFVGLSDSYEQYYQAIRRVWRFGQTNEVQCFIITSEAEGAVVANIERKEQDANTMAASMAEHMQAVGQAGAIREQETYATAFDGTENWQAYLGDCVETLRGMDSNSIDFSIFSPPFSSLYTYSNLSEDMGNCKTDEDFYRHYMFLVAEQFRTLKPGRLLSFHCMDIPSTKQRDGVIGIHDFPGDLIRMYEKAGFILHSKVVIWKDPVTAMQRTKSIGLLYKQLKKDSNLSRQGIPDYLITVRKPGVNVEPITKDPDEFPVSLWQNYASPVWMDINPSDTLQKESAREHADERHIAPLQLEVIRRAIRLWTNPGDLVLSPFMGIGSEGYVALELGRRFVGIELKQSYYKQAVLNLREAERLTERQTIFDLIDEVEQTV